MNARDSRMISQCEELEKLSLSTSDRRLVTLIKSQFEDDWRTPLIKTLNKLTDKYK